MLASERIKLLRTQKGMSQEELGKVIGVQRAAVQKWESGATQNLKRTTIQKLSEFFNVSPIYFIDDGSTENSQQTTDQQLEGIDFALYGELKDLTKEEKQDILNFIKFTKTQREK